MSKIFVINGRPESGKTTFERYCKKILEDKNYSVGIISTIDPIKDIAVTLGWNGRKDNKGRKFLSDLKDALEDYCDYSFNYIKDIAESGEYDFLFVDSREPPQIKMFCDDLNAESILIKRYLLDDKKYSNHADIEVENYNYDIVALNIGTLEELRDMAQILVDNSI